MSEKGPHIAPESNDENKHLGLGTIHAGEKGKSFLEAQEFFPGLKLAGSIAEEETKGLYTLTIAFEAEGAEGQPVSDVRVFRYVPLENPILGEVFVINDAWLKEYGFSVAPRVYQDEKGGEVEVEKRLKIIRDDTGEKQTVTLSLEDHWQNSHSHKTSIEQYTLTQGTIKIVEEYDGDGFKVTTVTRIEDGFRQEIQTFDSEGNPTSDPKVELVGDVSITTNPNVPHTVWASKGAVFGAVTKELEEGDRREDSDWQPEKDFDEKIRRAGL